MPFIQNVSYENFEKGFHLDPTENSIAIQMIGSKNDFGYEGEPVPFPKPFYRYKEIYPFRINDTIDESGITDDQAEVIVHLLKTAYKSDTNVIAHCIAGVSRSGAVVEIGKMIGFSDIKTVRRPNPLMVEKMLKFLNPK